MFNILYFFMLFNSWERCKKICEFSALLQLLKKVHFHYLIFEQFFDINIFFWASTKHYFEYVVMSFSGIYCFILNSTFFVLHLLATFVIFVLSILCVFDLLSIFVLEQFSTKSTDFDLFCIFFYFSQTLLRSYFVSFVHPFKSP